MLLMVFDAIDATTGAFFVCPFLVISRKLFQKRKKNVDWANDRTRSNNNNNDDDYKNVEKVNCVNTCSNLEVKRRPKKAMYFMYIST